MKRKLQLVLLGAVTLLAGTASAQTDVTSTYIANPSFELSAAGTDLSSTIQTSNTADAGIYGWTVTLANTKFINIDVVDATTANHSQFGTKVTPASGSYYMFYRHGWAKGVVDKFTTTSLSDLPEGKYGMSVAYKGAAAYDDTQSNSTLAISAVQGTTTLGTATSAAFTQYKGSTATTDFTDNDWSTLTTTFNVTETGAVDFVFTSNVNGQKRTDLLLDSITLVYYGVDHTDLTTEITTATTLLGTLTNPSNDYTNLNAAIATAQAVDDNISATAAQLVAAVAALKTAENSASAGIGEATATNPITTNFITNSSFETGDLSGWEYYKATDTGARLNSNSTYATAGVDGSYLFNTWDETSNAKYVKQTLTNLPAGYYTLSALIASDAGLNVSLYAGKESTSVTPSEKGTFVTGTTSPVKVEEGGSLEIGCTSSTWYKADKFVLVYNTLEGVYNAYLAEANALKDTTAQMSTATKAALETAINETEKTEATLAALKTAIANAKTSIASYKILASGVPDNSLTNWACTNGATFHVNTWSTEGATDGTNMVTPFIENWVSSGSTLPDGTIAYTLEGLDPGTYTASSLVRIYSEAGNDISGASFFVGSTDNSVDMGTTGTAITSGTKKIVYGNFSKSTTVGEDGVFTFGINIASATFNWIAFKSTVIGTPKDIFDAALSAANAALANTDYSNVTGEEKTALSTAIDTYTGITSDYETAASALTSATTTFTTAKTSYDAFVAAKTDPNLDYASEAAKTAYTTACNVTPTSAADAVEKTTAITPYLRAYYESNAKAEGITGATDYTSSITNPVVAGKGITTGWTQDNTNSASIGTNSGSPFVNSEGTSTSTYYYDGGNWSGTAWTVDFNQTLSSLPSGKYLLSVTSRASADLTSYQLYANNDSVNMKHINADASSGVFANGWNDASVEFELTADNQDAKIGVTAASSTTHNWTSFDNFRLYRYGNVMTTFSENKETNPVAAATSIDITLVRTFTTGKWSTFCAPFTITADEVTSLFGSDAAVATYTGKTDETLNFTKSTTGIAANTPCLIYTNTTSNSFIFSDKDIVSATPKVTYDDISFVGSYDATTVAAGDYYILDNTFYKASTEGAVTLKPFRAYFATSTALSAKKMTIDIDGETTSMDKISIDETNPTDVYNGAGQLVRSKATSLNGLGNGLYIMKGKKVYVK